MISLLLFLFFSASSFCSSYSFPGGKRDPTDTSVLDTALREMEEEIFISRDQVEVLGECAPLPNKGCTMKVHPFVGYIKEPIEDLDSIKFNKDEVQRVFTVPLQDLLNPDKRSMVQFRNSKVLYPVWKVDTENITIWGLTAFIIDGAYSMTKESPPTEGSCFFCPSVSLSVLWYLTFLLCISIIGVLRRIAEEGPTQAIEIPKGAPAEKYRPLMSSA